MTLPIAEILKADPSAELYVFILDATACGGGITNIAPEPNVLGTSMVWQGVSYTAMPIQVEGFEWSSKGILPRPKLKVAALDGLIGGMVRDYGDLVGVTVTVKHFFARHLDAVNFPGGVNANADPTACWPDEPWIIERKTQEDTVGGIIEWELSTPMDQQNAMIPKERITANVCGWQDATICPFSVGGLCGKKLANCTTHSTTDGLGLPAFTGGLPFSGEPGTARVR